MLAIVLLIIWFLGALGMFILGHAILNGLGGRSFVGKLGKTQLITKINEFVSVAQLDRALAF